MEIDKKLLGLKNKELVEQAILLHGDAIALLSAFNPEDVIISYWLGQINPNIKIFFLETAKHFPETLNYVERIISKLKLKNVEFLTPDPKLINNVDKNGKLWQTQVNRCCYIRKVEPLERALKNADFKAVITGRRKEQTQDRSNIDFVELDTETLRIKYNPLLSWSAKERDTYMDEHGLEQHPLYKLGYLSIGCAPCTTPVYLGEDERAGRWRHTRINNDSKSADDSGKTECGIHLALDNEQ